MSELGWRRVTEDLEDEDYIYSGSDGRMIGRVYLDIRVRHEDGYHWLWFFSSKTGHTPSRREAMLAVEEAYEKSRDGAEG